MKTWKTAFMITLVGCSLAACSAIKEQVAYIPAPTGVPDSPARIVDPPAPLQCVPYARKVSGISIRGDAWTWWRSAKGRYGTGNRPAVGAVLVLKPSQRLSLGHVAVVTGIINDRKILVDQANWLNRGRIHLSTPVIDVSATNDWSAVRVWYTPGNTYGARTYAAHGFIYPEPFVAAVRAQAKALAT